MQRHILGPKVCAKRHFATETGKRHVCTDSDSEDGFRSFLATLRTARGSYFAALSLDSPHSCCAEMTDLLRDSLHFMYVRGHWQKIKLDFALQVGKYSHVGSIGYVTRRRDRTSVYSMENGSARLNDLCNFASLERRWACWKHSEYASHWREC